METTHIYILIDPETLQVRYVGKANNISQRYRAHLNRARKHQIHKLNWINSLKKKGLKPIIEVIDIVPIGEWIFWETYWISQFKTWGFSLVNYTEGGDGSTFGNQTSFKKGNAPWNTGVGNTFICKECSSEFKASVSTKRKFCSKVCTSIHNSKNPNIGTFKSGTKPWNNGLSNYKLGGLKTSKVVEQYTLDSVFVESYLGCKAAALKVGCTHANIRNVCLGKSKTAKNFKWRFKNEQ